MIYDFEDLRSHIGHEIECVCYGKDGEEPVNVALECMSCGCVLIDLDKEDTISKEIAE